MSETTSSAVATAPKKPATVRDIIEGPAFKEQIAKVLPSILPPERFVRVAVTAFLKTPKLMECDQASLLQSLLNLAQSGLELDGRRAYLIPYGKTAQLIIGYQGIAELAMRSGLVSNIHADMVCENDAFEYDLGEIKTHKVDFKKPRGNAYAFYAICRFKDGSVKADVMNKDEIDAIRRRSKSGGNGPWVTDYNEMAKKTVFRRLSKWLPLSPEVQAAVESGDDAIDINPTVSISAVTARAEPLDPFVMPESTIQDSPAQ